MKIASRILKATHRNLKTYNNKRSNCQLKLVIQN